MKTIQTIATVSADGRLTIQLPADIAPGEHQIVLVIEEQLSPPLQPCELIGPGWTESRAATAGPVEQKHQHAKAPAPTNEFAKFDF